MNRDHLPIIVGGLLAYMLARSYPRSGELILQSVAEAVAKLYGVDAVKVRDDQAKKRRAQLRLVQGGRR